MSSETMTETRLICPSCRIKGKRVGLVTLRALLKDESMSEVETIAGHSCCNTNDTGAGCSATPEDTGWRFCGSAECEVVYFSEQSDVVYSKADLKRTGYNANSVGRGEASGQTRE